MKHTPGPWMAFGPSKGGALIEYAPEYIVMSPGEAVDGFAPVPALCNDGANAHLIATAPEMLALLIELVDMEGPQPGTSVWGDKAMALIAKAEGGAA